MIRIEIARRLDCRHERGSRRVNPTIVTHEPTVDAALDHIKAMRIAGDEIAPGYMPMLKADLFDHAAFSAWVEGTRAQKPAPLRTLSETEIAAL